MRENRTSTLDAVVEEGGTVGDRGEGDGGCLTSEVGFSFQEGDGEFGGVVGEGGGTGHSCGSAADNQYSFEV